MKCNCGNPEMNFDCTCLWAKNHPGDKEYSCQFCGIYQASEPRCNHCEENGKEHMNDAQIIQLYRAAFISCRNQGLAIPTVLELAEWRDLNRGTEDENEHRERD
jgi:hypothetical protein